MNPQAQEIKKFENENVSVEAIWEPGCHVKLNVVAAPKLVSESYKEATQRVRKEIVLPGFRKGKAPEALVLSHYTKAVEGEWKDALLNEAFQEALKLTTYAPLKATAKSIKSAIKEIKTHKDSAELSFEFESAPDAPNVDLSKISLPSVETKDVSNHDVNEMLEQARLSLASWEELDRAAEAEDFVRLDLEEVLEGGNRSDFNDKRFQITDKKMSKWLRELVIGLKVNESKEGMSQPEDALIDEEDKSLFQPALFKVTVRAVEKPILPELSDDFAKRLGAQTLEDAKVSIRRQMEHSAKIAQRDKQRKHLEDYLVAHYSFDLPKSLVQKESQTVRNNALHALEQNQNLSEQEKESERARIDEKAHADSVRHLTLYYLMKTYNANHDVQVTQDDLNAELNRLLQNVPKELVSQILKSLNEEIFTAILAEVTIRKGLESLLDKVLAH